MGRVVFSGVEGEGYLDESVVRADGILYLECRKLLGIGRKARLLNSEEHEYSPLEGELGFQAGEALPFAAICSSRRARRSANSKVSTAFAVFVARDARLRASSADLL